METYNQTFDEFLNHKESLFNQFNAGEKLNFLDSLETTLTEMLQEGKIASSGANGLEISIDKGNKIPTLTLTTLVDSSGVRKIVLGNLVPSLDVYFDNTLRSRVTGNTAGGIIYFYDTATNVVGDIYGDSLGIHLYSQDSTGDMEVGFNPTSDNTGNIQPAATHIINLGASTAEFNNAFFDGTVQTDALRIDQTPTAEVNTATHYATVDFNGTNYKVLLKSV